jgi:peptidoglycan/LPS O-acetylase OafA/YrhL
MCWRRENGQRWNTQPVGFGRLYSVILPALALAALSHYLVELRHPTQFYDFAAAGRANVAISYLATAFLTSHFWIWPDGFEPPAADPFWSLSYEASYYVAIGLAVFARGSTRVISIAAVALLAGPSVVLFAPIWLLGYSAYRLAPLIHLRSIFALMLWLLSTTLLLLSPIVEMRVRYSLPFLRMPDPYLGHILAAYAAGLCFAVGLTTFNAASTATEPVLWRVQNVIRWLGSITFALYLFHQPLLTLFSVYPTANGSYAIRMGAMVGGTFFLVATLGWLCEKSKGSYKRAFLSLWRIAAGNKISATYSSGRTVR